MQIKEDKIREFTFNTLVEAVNNRHFRNQLEVIIPHAKKLNVDLKDIIKKAYNKNIYFGKDTNKDVVDALNSYPVINYGTQYSKWQDGRIDEDSWTNWYIIETKSEVESEMIVEAIDVVIKIYGEDIISEDRINSSYDCTGEVFSDDMHFIRVGKNRVLAKKYFGRDV